MTRGSVTGDEVTNGPWWRAKMQCGARGDGKVSRGSLGPRTLEPTADVRVGSQRLTTTHRVQAMRARKHTFLFDVD